MKHEENLIQEDLSALASIRSVWRIELREQANAIRRSPNYLRALQIAVAELKTDPDRSALALRQIKEALNPK